jgi:hypothetical protein
MQLRPIAGNDALEESPRLGQLAAMEANQGEHSVDH